MVKLSKRDNLHKLHNLSLLVELVQMLKLAILFNGTKCITMHFVYLKNFSLIDHLNQSNLLYKFCSYAVKTNQLNGFNY